MFLLVHWFSSVLSMLVQQLSIICGVICGAVWHRLVARSVLVLQQSWACPSRLEWQMLRHAHAGQFKFNSCQSVSLLGYLSVSMLICLLTYGKQMCTSAGLGCVVLL
jgi:hypothetical protein